MAAADRTAGAASTAAASTSAGDGGGGLVGDESAPFGGGIVGIRNVWLRRLGVIWLWAMLMPIAYGAVLLLGLCAILAGACRAAYEEGSEVAGYFADVTQAGVLGTRLAWKRRR